MLREKIVTIVIGLVVGAMLAGAYFFGPTLVAKTKTDSTKQTPTPIAKISITPTNAPKKTLTLTTPENNSSTTKEEIKVSGAGTPNAKIIVFSNADQKQITAGANGKFDTTIKLEEGENEVTVTDLTPTIQTLTRNVTLEISE